MDDTAAASWTDRVGRLDGVVLYLTRGTRRRPVPGSTDVGTILDVALRRDV